MTDDDRPGMPPPQTTDPDVPANQVRWLSRLEDPLVKFDPEAIQVGLHHPEGYMVERAGACPDDARVGSPCSDNNCIYALLKIEIAPTIPGLMRALLDHVVDDVEGLDLAMLAENLKLEVHKITPKREIELADLTSTSTAPFLHSIPLTADTLRVADTKSDEWEAVRRITTKHRGLDGFLIRRPAHPKHDPMMRMLCYRNNFKSAFSTESVGDLLSIYNANR